jgi:hypothetical protein
MSARIVWVDQGPQPQFVEDVFDGSLDDARRHLERLSTDANACLLGQVLHEDGRVYATVSGGMSRLAAS